MNTINKDSLFSIISYLNVKDFKNVARVNKFSNSVVKKNKKLIFKNKVIENWGNNIFNILPHDKIENFTKFNLDTFSIILDIFYHKVLVDNIFTSSHLLIEIYDNSYIFCNTDEYNREYLFNKRTKSIRRILKNKYISYDDKKVIFILNSTSYLNRFCNFLDHHQLGISIPKIIDIINRNV